MRRNIDLWIIQECSNVYVYDDFLSEFGLLDKDEDMLTYNFPYYSEQYTWDDSHDWLIYTSHEGTITFAGEELVKAIKDKFLNLHIDEVDINNIKVCSNCGKVTWHINHMRNIVYRCSSCNAMFYLKSYRY